MTEHLVASTLTAAAIVLLVIALRGRTAQLRFSLLLLALLRFAIPTGWLTDAGTKLARQVPVQTERARAFSDWDMPLKRVVAAPAASAAHIPGAAEVLEVLWAAGAVLYFSLWMRQFRMRRPRVRAANEREEQALMAAHERFSEVEEPELRVAQTQASVGALGIWRHQIVLPDGLADQLSDGELVAIFSHELAHFARWDNLTALGARMVVSVFWFHPLVWWLERRMLAERELACDELVLVRGTGVNEYASALSKASCATVVTEPGYALMAGQNLRTRLERIMSFSRTVKVKSDWRGLSVASAALVLVLPVSVAYLNAQAPRSDPRADALYLEANLAYSKHDYASAEQIFQRIKAEFPADSRGLLGLAEIAVVTERPADARAMLEREIGRTADSRNIHLALANVAVRTGDFTRAIGALRPLIEQEPGSADLQMRMGEVYLRSNKPLEALPFFENASRLDATNTVPLVKMGLIYERTGEIAKALATCEAVLKLEPNNALALNNLAYYMSEAGGDLDRALVYALKAKLLQPDNADIADTLGWLYLKQGRANDALPEFGQAILKSSKTSPSIRKHLAAALDQISAPAPDQSELRALLAGDESPATDEKIREVLTRMK